MSRRRVTRIPVLFVIAAIPLIPDPPKPVERVAESDLELVRAAECRYRGITANFDELTRAYALTAYSGSQLEGWSSRPNPLSPETEALVTCRFRVTGVRSDSAAGGTDRPELRNRVRDRLEVTWKLNTLASAQVTPHDGFAQDALDVFRHTVDGMLDRMVLLLETTSLHRSPAGVETVQLDGGTLLLREARDGDWTRVRVPSDTTAGWIHVDQLHSIYGN